MAAAQSELSMDEILASIRRIIHEEEQPAPAVARGGPNTVALEDERRNRPEIGAAGDGKGEKVKTAAPVVNPARVVEGAATKPMDLRDFGGGQTANPGQDAHRTDNLALQTAAALGSGSADAEALAASLAAPAAVAEAQVTHPASEPAPAATRAAPTTSQPSNVERPREQMAERPRELTIEDAIAAQAAHARKIAEQAARAAAPPQPAAPAGEAAPTAPAKTAPQGAAGDAPVPEMQAAAGQAAAGQAAKAKAQTNMTNGLLNAALPSDGAAAPETPLAGSDDGDDAPADSAPAKASAVSQGTDDAQTLLAAEVSKTIADQFASLRKTVQIAEGGSSLEAMVREMLKPMLKAWLDENLPGLVERKIEAEIRRFTGQDD